MRTFWAVTLAALAGLLVIGAASSIHSHDDGGAMFLGLLGGAALMGSAILAFRRPTEGDRRAKRATDEAKAAVSAQQPKDKRLAKGFGAAVFVVALVTTQHLIRKANDGGWTLAAEADYPPLSGSARTDFTEAGLKTCLERQRLAPENAGIPIEYLQEYCHCYMNSLADSISNKELASFRSKDAAPPQLASRMEQAGNACILRLVEKLTPKSNR
jgi:hypothetical protein